MEKITSDSQGMTRQVLTIDATPVSVELVLARLGQQDILRHAGLHRLALQRAVQNARELAKEKQKAFTKKISAKANLKLRLILSEITGLVKKWRDFGSASSRKMRADSDARTDAIKRVREIITQAEACGDVVSAGKDLSISEARSADANVSGALAAIQSQKSQARVGQVTGDQILVDRGLAGFNRECGAIRQALDAMKKTAIFRKIFAVLTPVIQLGSRFGLAALTAGASLATGLDIISNQVTRIFMDGLQLLVQKPQIEKQKKASIEMDHAQEQIKNVDQLKSAQVLTYNEEERIQNAIEEALKNAV